MTTTANRSDIILTEESESTFSGPRRWWEATFTGALTRDGRRAEYVSGFTRTGSTPDVAVAALEEALAVLGWEVR